MVFKSFSDLIIFMDKKENVRKVMEAALQIIRERRERSESAYVESKDIPGRTDVSRTSAALILHYNYQQCGLVQVNRLKNRGSFPIMAYAEREEDIPYLPREKTPEEIEENELRKIKNGGRAYLRAKQKRGEPISERIDNLLENLHRKEGEKGVNLNKIRRALELEFNKNPKSDMLFMAMDIWDNGMNKGKYVWHSGEGEGYSTISD